MAPSPRIPRSSPPAPLSSPTLSSLRQRVAHLLDGHAADIENTNVRPAAGPAPVMISATPSPVTSAAATLTPPGNAGS